MGATDRQEAFEMIRGQNRRKGTVAGMGLLLGGLLVLGSCGSSGGLSPEPALPGESGTLEISVEPPGSGARFVPPNALSAKAFVFVEGEQNPNASQASDTGNLPAPVVLTDVPAGPKDVRVWAYDGLDGTGNSVAYGVAQVRLLGGRNNTVTVHLVAWRLIFVSDRDGNGELYRATPDGRFLTRLTNNSVTDERPAPSPNGQKIAYTSWTGSEYQVCLYDNGSGANAVFANLAGSDYGPAWSPDSNTIIWVNYNAGTYTLEKKNLDGSGVASLSFGGSEILRPACSPDGSRIAVQYYDGSDYEIGVLWANLTAFSLLTSDSLNQTLPVWSPDGASIYCSAMDSTGLNANSQLARLDGSLYPGASATVTLITNEPWNHWLWDVSPDGALLACYANPPWINNWDIYYYSATSSDGQPRVRVTYNTAWDGYPCFLPPPTGGGPITPQ